MIGPVMIGPSSSHTAGAARLAWLARQILPAPPTRVEFGLHGSFAETGEGHGTKKALLGGALGLAPDDERIKEAEALAQANALAYAFKAVELGDVHPNSVRIVLENDDERVVVYGSSLGGGLVKIWRIDEFEAHLTGQAPALLVKHVDTPGVIARVARVLADDEVNIAYLTSSRAKKGGEALMSIEMDRPLSELPLAYLNHLAYILWARAVPPLPGS